MPFFIVTMTHPDGDGWDQHVVPHVEYLLDLIERGVLLASGPLKGTPLRAGFLIFQASSRDDVERLVAEDPFAKHDLIVALSIEQWDPLFGAFEQQSSRTLPPAMAELKAKGLYPSS